MSAFSRLALALFFVLAGALHFITPAPYLAIMPSSVPLPAAMIALSGIAEIVGGLGVLFRSTRRAAGVWLIALLIAVFPANVHAISTGMVIADNAVPAWMLWARLPLQLLLILWVWRACLGRGSRRPKWELRSERGWKASHLRL
jgi:uncharacterized membrane protein